MQSDADYCNRDGCRLIAQRQIDTYNHLGFKEIYSSRRFTEKLSGLLNNFPSIKYSLNRFYTPLCQGPFSPPLIPSLKLRTPLSLTFHQLRNLLAAERQEEQHGKYYLLCSDPKRHFWFYEIYCFSITSLVQFRIAFRLTPFSSLPSNHFKSGYAFLSSFTLLLIPLPPDVANGTSILPFRS